MVNEEVKTMTFEFQRYIPNEQVAVEPNAASADIWLNAREALLVAFRNLGQGDDERTSFARTKDWYRSSGTGSPG